MHYMITLTATWDKCKNLISKQNVDLDLLIHICSLTWQNYVL